MSLSILLFLKIRFMRSRYRQLYYIYKCCIDRFKLCGQNRYLNTCYLQLCWNRAKLSYNEREGELIDIKMKGLFVNWIEASDLVNKKVLKNKY